MAKIEDLLYHSGYLGLFIISFIAATVFPLSSEIFVMTMTLSGYNPLIILSTATTGNTLGAIINYYVGKYGADFIFSRYIKVDSDTSRGVAQKYQKWGSPILLFAWAPVVGDPLTVVAGVLNIKIYIFTFWVTLGKALRYGFLIATAGML